MMLLVLVLLVGSVAAQTSSEGRQFLCGRVLARAHSIYCYDIDPMPEETGHNSIPVLDANVVGIQKIPGRFTHKLRRSVAQMSQDKFMSSLVETCCVNPCAVSDLLNHC